MYESMLSALGPSRWWPGDSPFEVAVGAILTQNTNWRNVEKAIENLKRSGKLSPRALYEIPAGELAALIRPAGYYSLKASRLKNFIAFLEKEAGLQIESLASEDPATLRPKILQVKGIGPETADSILLYALGMPSFVVDAYTARIMSRHGLVPEDASYHELQEYFMDALDADPAVFNEYHALLVRTGKDWCRKKAPLCEGCPLEKHLN
jgi:endonuclease-3 related protein